MNFQLNNFRPKGGHPQGGKFKTKKIAVFALLLIFIFSNFIFVFERTYALESTPAPAPNPGDEDFIGPLPAPNPGDPGFIGPVQPKGILATISGGLCGAIDAVKNTITGAVTGTAKKAESGLMDSGLNSLGLSSSGGGGVNSALGNITGIAGDIEVPVKDQKTRDNTGALKTKETCQDTIIVPMAKYLIRQMTKDLVNWIKGKDGQPRFIQNFGDFLKEAADREGGILLEQILGKGNAEKLCEPWKIDLALKILGPPKRKGEKFEPQCKISEIIGAAEEAGINFDVDVERQKKRRVGNFINDFSQGGWPAFLTTVFDNESNYPGYALTLMDKKERLKAEAVKAAEVEAVSGSGILAGICMEKEKLTLDAHGEKKQGKAVCKRSKILTPGAAIVGALPDFISSPLKELQVADEINEIVFALVDRMTQKNFWEGIMGSDEPDSEGRPLRGFNGIETTDEEGNPLPDEFDINDFEPATQIPSLLTPKNRAVITKPIFFDFTDVNLGFETVEYYQIFITLPDNSEKTINTETAADPDGTLTDNKTDDIAPSDYQMTEEDFLKLNIGGTYLWRAAAVNEKNEIIGGVTGISEENNFIIPMPTIVNPKENEIMIKPIKFDWKAVQTRETAQYKFELTNLTISDEAPVLKDIEATNYTQTKEEFAAMRGGDYLLKITAVDKSGAQIGGQGSVRFKTLAIPKLVSPQDAENILSTTLSAVITFDWEDTPLATNYEISIKKKGGGYSQTEETTVSEFKTDELGKNKKGKYVWKVRAIIRETTTDDAGNIIDQDTTSIWSEEREFELTE